MIFFLAHYLHKFLRKILLNDKGFFKQIQVANFINQVTDAKTLPDNSIEN